MSGIGDLLGGAVKNDSAQQLFLWGVLYGLLGTVFEPVITEIGQEVWEAAVEANLHRALPPEQLAVMVVRGWITEGAGQAEAAKSGVAQNDFNTMVNNARNPIPPEQAAVALRRLLIPHDADPAEPSFMNAIRQGNLGDQWATVVQELAKIIPTPADILNAQLQGQIPNGVDPVALYERVGGVAVDPHDGFDWFTLMFNTRGSAPTPMEAIQMANRGIIPWGDGTDGPKIEGPGSISFYQAFLEGPWRNKWEPAFRDLGKHIPPPRTVTTLLREGAISADQAVTLLEHNGLEPALAQAYVKGALTGKTTTAKLLAKSDITAAYEAHLITEQQAVAFLEKLGYDSSEAATELALADYRITNAALNKAVNRVASFYISRKLTAAEARSWLARLGLPQAKIDADIQTWTIEQSASVRILTEAQIVDAWEYGILSQDEATTELEALGYTPFDAWTLLSIKAKGPLPNPPARGPGVIT